MMSTNERYRILKYISQSEYRTLDELNAFCDFKTFLNESGGRTIKQVPSQQKGTITYAINTPGARFIEVHEAELEKEKKTRRQIIHNRTVAYLALGLGAAALALQLFKQKKKHKKRW